MNSSARNLSTSAEIRLLVFTHHLGLGGGQLYLFELLRLLSRIPDAVVHARNAARAPHILNISVPGTDSESLLMALDLQGVAASSGSACQSGSVSPSHVLAAIGVGNEMASAAIRMSLGALTTDEGIDRVAQLFPALIAKARRLSGVMN